MIFSLVFYTCLATIGADGIGHSTGKNCRVHQVNVQRMGLGTCYMAGAIESAKYWDDQKHTRIVVGFKCSDRPQKFLHANEA